MKSFIPLEKDIKEAILSFLHSKKIFCWPNDSTGIYDPVRKVFRKKQSKFWIKGVPDILGVLPCGSFLGIEVKRPQVGKMSPDQERFRNRVVENNGYCIVAHSVKEVESWYWQYIELQGDEE